MKKTKLIIAIVCIICLMATLVACSSHDKGNRHNKSDKDNNLIIGDKDDNGSTNIENECLDAARSYIAHMPYSKNRLIMQLDAEGYSKSEIDYAIRNMYVDWNNQALRCAQGYMEMGINNWQDLYDRLIAEDFTHDQACYGCDHALYG